MNIRAFRKEAKEVSSSRRWMQALVVRQATRAVVLKPAEALEQPAQSHVIFERNSESQRIHTILEEISHLRGELI